MVARERIPSGRARDATERRDSLATDLGLERGETRGERGERTEWMREIEREEVVVDATELGDDAPRCAVRLGGGFGGVDDGELEVLHARPGDATVEIENVGLM